MSFWSYVQAVRNLAYNASPAGLTERAATAVVSALRNEQDDKVDVAVIGRKDGGFGDAWNLVTDRADSVVWRPDSVDAAVDGILQKANGRTLRTLSINGHGAPGRQTLGNFDFANAASFSPKLSELGAAMDRDTVVTLRGCNVGTGEKGESLLRGLAELWGVEVRAGLETQYPMGEGLEGPILSCKPDDEGKVQCEHLLSD